MRETHIRPSNFILEKLCPQCKRRVLLRKLFSRSLNLGNNITKQGIYENPALCLKRC